jgi:hypothetical protein
MTEEGRGPGTGTQLPQIPFAVNFFGISSVSYVLFSPEEK